MYDCIIIGAGPSGLMAGIIASKTKKVLIIEKNKTPGKKLLLTGNGRCNITNLKDNSTFIETISYNKKYIYSTINNFGPYDIYNYFTTNNVPLKEEEENKIFPQSDKAIDILNALMKNTQNITFAYNEEVLDIKNTTPLEIITSKNNYKTKNIIIATGGTSFKQTGSSGDHMKFAQILNQPTIPLYPKEVGVILDKTPSLEGTAFEKVTVKYLKYQEQGKLIFTHKGLGASSIMSLSEHIYKNKEKELTIDFLPDKTSDTIEKDLKNYYPEKELTTFLTTYFTNRFSTYIVQTLNYPKNIKIKQLNNKQIKELIETIKNKKYQVKEVDDINNAYITGGGIDLKYINTKTMESTINKNIYFVGEALDIQGPIGGYNLTLALSTGYTVK